MVETYEEKLAVLLDIVNQAKHLSKQNPSIDDFHLQEYEDGLTYKERRADPIVDDTSFSLASNLIDALQTGRFTDYLVLRHRLVGERDRRDNQGDLGRNRVPLNIAMVIEKSLVTEGVLAPQVFMAAYGLNEDDYLSIPSLKGRWLRPEQYS